MESNNNPIPVDFNPFSEDRQIEKVVPTTEAQKEMWLSCIIGGPEANLAYNESISVKLEGVLNLDFFQRALQEVVSKHEALRSAFSGNGESIVIYNHFPANVIITELDHETADQQQDSFRDFIKSEMNNPFSLINGPLFRFFVHKLADELHYFTLFKHHIAGDGWSTGVIIEHLAKCYNALSDGKPIYLPRPNQISDYAKEELIYTKSGAHKISEQYWLDLYKEIPSPLDLPTDYPRRSPKPYHGNRLDFRINGDFLTDIKKVGAKVGCTLVNTLTAAFEVLLHHKTGQQDVTLGLPTAGQIAVDKLDLVGHCVNFLPLRSHVNPNLSFMDYLRQRKTTLLDALEHQRFTYGSLIKKLNIVRDNTRIPLTPVVFNIDIGMDTAIKFAGIDHTLISNPREYEAFELFLNITQSKNNFIFEWSYKSDLFKTETIERMMDELKLIIQTAGNTPSTAIKDLLPLANPFPEYSDYRIEYPQDITLLDLFASAAMQHSDRISLQSASHHLTYSALDEKSTQLANYLNHTAPNADFIPLFIQPCPEMIIGVMGILKAGKAYVPIDTELPQQRIGHILAECASPVIISDSESVILLQHIETDDQRVCLLDDSSDICWTADSLPNTDIWPQPEDKAYMIYTSGSTGNPKGVCITHRSLIDYIYGLQKSLPVLADCENFSFGNTISTDLGNTVLYHALTSGGTLHLFTKERFNDASFIGQYFQQHQIDCMKIVPSHWKYLSEAVGGLFPRKLLIFGGEALHSELIKDIDQAGADCMVVNHYGPTETTIGKLMHVVDPKRQYQAVVPIGKPFSNTSIFVLNKHLSFCPVGVTGELYIGGEGIAMGYHNQPELTDKAFIQNPFTDHPHKRLYRTGDMVRWLPDGNIEYLGRGDDQVKIRGNRIEIGEVQNAILSLEGIKNCAVIADHDSNSEKRLVAYVVTGNTSFDKAEAIRLLGNQLPNYMVPKTWVIIDELPLNANGKVDKKLLPKAERITDESGYRFVAPRTKAETLLIQIWQDCLKLEKISVQDDFFELGGHSLIAIKVMLEIEKKTGKRIPITSFFEYPTIERLASLVEQSLDGQFVWKSLVPIKPQGSKPPLYIVHGMGLEVLVFHSLAKHFNIEQPIYGLKAKGLDGITEPDRTVQQIAEHYIQEILENNPDGPYSIAGYSSGGIIAFEMAHQLKAMGRQVKFLGLIDSFSNEDGHKKLISEKKFLAYFFFLCKKAIYNLLFLFKRPKQFLKDRYWYLCWRFGLNKDKSFVEGSYEQTINQIVQIHFDAIYNKYQLQPYDGFTYLFKASELFSYTLHNKSNGWYPYLTGGIELKKIKAGHFNLFESPQIEALAAEIQKSLDVALLETFSEKANTTL